MNDTDKIISNLAKDIVDKGFAVPAIFFLESTKYISFIGSQLLVFIGPFATCFVNNQKYNNFVEILEKKGNIDFLVNEIERINLETQS